MKKFICRLLIFLIPFYFVGIFIGFFYYIGWTVGELADFDRMIEAQRQNHDIFIGMGYNEQTVYYKLENANYYQADVIALGTSRVMQFKNDYFYAGFYNCGGAVKWNYDEYLNFLKNLDYTPEIIIIGLDQWVFNEAWNQNCVGYEDYSRIEMLYRNRISIMRDMTNDFVSHRWDFHNIENYPMNYGFNGRIRDNGFQWDGSYYYGDTYRETESQKDYTFADIYYRVDEGLTRFERGEHVDDKTYEYLAELLEYCSENGITVIGFTPPFAPSIYNRMIASGNYGYLKEISPRCKLLFEEYGYEYYDYTDVSALAIDGAYFVDGIHGGEVAYAYMVQDMIVQGSCLREYVDVDVLNELLDNRYSTLLLKELIHGK